MNGLSDSCEIQAASAGDCNANFIPDSCDIASGAADLDHDGVPDQCECFPDIVAPFGQVNIDDLVYVINHWGIVNMPGDELADLAPYPQGGNGVVNIDDLVAVITHWGTCPP
jgi:hypothetical protein